MRLKPGQLSRLSRHGKVPAALSQQTTCTACFDGQAAFCRRRHQPRRPPLAKIRPGSPAPTMGPGTAAGAKLVSCIPSAPAPPVVSVKKLVPCGAFPEPKRLKSPQAPVKHVPHGPPGVDCPTSCVVKSNVALVPQRNVSPRDPGEKSFNPNVPLPVPAPLTVRDRAVMKLVTGEKVASPIGLFTIEWGFGRVVRSKVIRALAVAPLPRLAPDHSTSNVWKTSAFAGAKRDDPHKRAMPMTPASFDFMKTTPSERITAAVTRGLTRIDLRNNPQMGAVCRSISWTNDVPSERCSFTASRQEAPYKPPWGSINGLL